LDDFLYFLLKCWGRFCNDGGRLNDQFFAQSSVTVWAVKRLKTFFEQDPVTPRGAGFLVRGRDRKLAASTLDTDFGSKSWADQNEILNLDSYICLKKICQKSFGQNPRAATEFGKNLGQETQMWSDEGNFLFAADLLEKHPTCMGRDAANSSNVTSLDSASSIHYLSLSLSRNK
jgi:hypothetical protein